MASGKSTIGKLLAARLKIPFIDLDDYIAAKENLEIPELFSKKGEIYFRHKETEYLKEILCDNDSFVLAVGGGTPCYGNNMDVINEHGISIFLNRSLKDTYGLLSKPEHKNNRPLIAGIKQADLKEFIAKHLFERLPYYNRAILSIVVDDKAMETVVAEIEEMLGHHK